MIALNLLTFIWFSYQESFSEPGKMEHQVTSKGVKMLRLLSEREPIRDVSLPVKGHAETMAMCHIIGPFNKRDLARNVLAEIEGFGREGSLRHDKKKMKYAYWVYLESMPEDVLVRTIEELEAQQVTDYHRNNLNELSLGMYSDIQGAERRKMDIAALGYIPLIGSLYRTQIDYWIDVTDMYNRKHTDDAWETYLSRFPHSQRKSTRCDLINA
jgi:hypothetical protein